MKNILVIKFSLVILILLFIFSCNKQGSEPNNGEYNKEKTIEKEDVEIPNFDFLPTSTSGELVVHSYFTLSYKEEYEQAEWVAYEFKNNLESHNFERPFFIEDKKVPTGSADWKNYKHSGYDKGHLCPAGDMRFSKDAYFDTFFTSNISPQKHEFNDGIWNVLEEKVRYWANKYDGIYVVTGGVLNGNLKKIGKEQVAVPDYFYKVLLDFSNAKYKMIGFLVPAVDSKEPLYKFVVPVDEIESKTGIDFYPKLEDNIENQLEKSSDYKAWSFN